MEDLIANWADAIAWWWAVGLFLVFAALETAWPARPGSSSSVARWAENFALYAGCLGALYWIAPNDIVGRFLTVPPGRSLFGMVHQIGGNGLVLATGILATDFLVYLVHVVQHHVFVLWRFHAVHHSDEHVDVTTGLRHHPAEVFVNALFANIVLISLGQPLWVAAVYGIVSMTASLFNHSNVIIPAALDRVLRAVFITPGLHRLHHAVDAAHYNTNFGNIFSFWDRLCGTYRRLPDDEAAAISFGIDAPVRTNRFGPLREWILPFIMRRPPRSAEVVVDHS